MQIMITVNIKFPMTFALIPRLNLNSGMIDAILSTDHSSISKNLVRLGPKNMRGHGGLATGELPDV
jgi:hypothetical protein